MTQWARTSTGDIVLPRVNSGVSALVTDPTKCTQIKLTDRLNLVLGEWFLNTKAGFPWLAILGQIGLSVPVAKSMLRKYILACPGVIGISNEQLTLNRGPRAFSYSSSAKTASGVAKVNTSGPFGQ